MRLQFFCNDERGKWMSLSKTQMSSTRQDQSVHGESFSVSKTAKIDPEVEAGDSLAGGVTLAIRGSCMMRRRRKRCRQRSLWHSGCAFQVDPRRLVVLDNRHQGSDWEYLLQRRAEDGIAARRGRRCGRPSVWFLKDPTVVVLRLAVRFEVIKAGTLKWLPFA